MTQTKKQSFTESVTNTAIGFVVSLASSFVIFPLVGFKTNAGINAVVTLYFTGISILRSYFIRRYFNKKTITGVPRMKNPPKPQKKHQMNANKLANKWIAEMQEAGLTSDQMANVIQLARQKFNKLKTTCECGNQHPLVAEFGKCGSCYTKMYGGNGDPTYS